MESKKVKIAVIDPVGEKAGMNYYNLGLLGGLSNLGVQTHLFSNSSLTPYRISLYPYFGLFFKSKILQACNEFSGHVKSFVKCKYIGVDYVIMHVFSTQFFFLLFFLIAKLLRLKVIAIAHDVSSLASDDSYVNKKWIYNYLCEYVVVHNKFSANEIKGVLSSKKIANGLAVIQQGGYLDLVNPKITKKDAIRQLGLSDDKKYILFFGQIKKTKRLDLLIKSLAYVPNVNLIIAGRPWKANFDEYQKLIDELGLESRVIKMIRFVSDEERELLMKAADIAAFPYEEIYQSAALLMSMTYGLAPVTSDILAFQEVIEDHKNGRVFKNGDFEHLGTVLQEMLKDDKILMKLKESSLQTIKEDFSWLNIAKEYKKTFNL